MKKAVKVGLVFAITHLVIFGFVWVMATWQIGCSDWACFGYGVLVSMPWWLLLLYFPFSSQLVNVIGIFYAIVILLNFSTYFFIGYLLAKLFSRKSKSVIPSDTSNG